VAEAHARATLGHPGEARTLIAGARDTVALTEATLDRTEIDYVEVRIRALSGDRGGARVLLESPVEWFEEPGVHRYADRYRGDMAVLDCLPE